MPRPQSGELKFVVTNTLIVQDIQRSVAFYRDVLGATVLRRGRTDLPAAPDVPKGTPGENVPCGTLERGKSVQHGRRLAGS
jgi:catechol 2,3-dioxygenase-like lactoylglutathione lyase family enzyme